MRFKLFLLLGLLVTMAGCRKNDGDPERGAVLTLTELKNDPVSDIRLWVYDNNGKLVNEYSYRSYTELADALLPLPAGEYTFVVATNIVEPFKVQKSTTATTDLENLYIKLNDASSSPAHAHYGVEKATIAADDVTRVPLRLNRVMAEMGFMIKNIPAEVVKATLQITNVAEGFYPGIGKLSAQTAVASLGEQTSQGGTLTFPAKRIMPVVTPAVRSGETELKTLLQLTVTYTTGATLTFDLEAPATQNGGSYTPEIEYSILRQGITIEVDAINGWVELLPVNGEILNPNN